MSRVKTNPIKPAQAIAPQVEIATDPFALAKATATAAGGFVRDLPNHMLVHIPASSDAPNSQRRLVVTYDNLASRKEEKRLPWGQSFLEGQGWDTLGVMVKRNDWFRDPDLRSALQALADEGFFASYGAVSAFGSSMGAYGALVFSACYPGATVLAFAPQSTLNTDVATFEKRYRYARRTIDWAGPMHDAAPEVGHAGKVYLAYDPYLAPDAAHAKRLSAPNVVPLRMPFLGHKLPPQLLRMRLLKTLSAQALVGDFDPADLPGLLRARRRSMAYLRLLLPLAQAKGHTQLALGAAEQVMRDTPNWQIGKLRRQFNAEIKDASKSA